MRKVAEPTIKAMWLEGHNPVIEFLKLLAKVKKYCEADNIYLRVISDPILEFEIVVNWFVNGQNFTYQKHYSIFEHLKNPEIEMQYFAEAAKNAFMKAKDELQISQTRQP